jgi:inosose dehydratase
VSAIRVANAPCSWGTIEGFGGGVPWQRMLDELVDTGYQATELGDLGYLPSEPNALREALSSRGLALLGGFEAVPLLRAGVVGERRERLLTIARLMAAVADVGDAGRPPWFILADDSADRPARMANAGRITAAHALDLAERARFAANAEEVARLVAGETGLRTLYHHHCGHHVETPDEIEAFLDATDPALLQLVFDTGHAVYGSGQRDDDGRLALRLMERWWERIAYVHFKDCESDVAERARREGWTYGEAVGAGVFCELGRGSVDFAAVLAGLRERGYDDWITVEQDVLPGMGTPAASARRNRDTLRALGL